MLFMLLNFSSSVWAAKIYLNTNEVNDINWGKDNAWFFAHIWSDGGSSSDVKMTSAGNGYYSCDVPDDKNKIIFVRKNPSNSELNFNNKWGQTKDLTIPTDGNNLFTPNGWDNCDGTWSTYEEEDLPDALPDAVLCGKKNVLFFEDFGTLDGEQNRKQNNQIDGQNFYTSYNYIAECAKIKNAGEYAIVATPRWSGCSSKQDKDYENTCACGNSDTGKWWYNENYDHTDDDGDGNPYNDAGNGLYGGMLQFDCRNGSSTDVLYQRTVSGVCSNTLVNFSAWLTKANVSDADAIKARFVLRKGGADGEIIGRKDIEDIKINEGWKQISAMFNSDTLNTDGEITIQLINLAPYGQNGNDILLDDLELSVCTPKASLVCSDGTSTEKILLPGESEELTASIVNGVMTNPFYYWLYYSNRTGWMPLEEPQQGLVKYTVTPGLNISEYKVIITQTPQEAYDIASDRNNVDACGMYAVTNLVTLETKNLNLTTELSDDNICADGVDENTLTFTVKNTIGITVSNVKVKVNIPTEVTSVSVAEGSGYSNGVWTIGTIANNATAELKLTLKSATTLAVASKDVTINSFISGINSLTYNTYEDALVKKENILTVKAITTKPSVTDYANCPIDGSINLADLVDFSPKTGLNFYNKETGALITNSVINVNNTNTTDLVRNYLVSNTLTGECESEKADLKVTVYGQPTASLSGSTTICNGGSANLNIQLNGKANYSITLSNGEVKPDVSGNTAQMTVSPDVTTTYTIRSVIDGNGCEATTSGSAKVTVNEKPVIEFTENPLPEYCAGVEYTLPAPTVDNKGANITESGWYLADDELTNSKIKFTTEDNAKSLVYKAKNICGETTATFVTSLNVADCAQLTLSYQLDKSSYCEGDDAVLTATLYNGSALDLDNVEVRQSWAGKQSSVLSEVSKGTYTNNIWSIGKLTQGETVTLTISFNVEEAEVFKIYVSAANGETYTFDNSVEKSTAQLVVKSYSDNVTVNNYAKCPINANSFLITDLVTSDNNDLKVWTKNAATGLYEKLDEVPTIDPKQTLPATTYYITNTERGKCESTTPTAVTVEVFPQPTATLSGDATICNGGSANLLVTLTGKPSYTVKLSDGSKPTLNATENITVNPTTTTTYSLTEVKDGNGCYATLSGNATVTVNHKPVITLSRVDLDDFCPGDVLTLPANVEVEDNGATITSQGWLLNGVSTTSAIELNASHNNAVIEYTATNECGTATAVEYATIVVKEISDNVVACDYIACPTEGQEFPITDLVASTSNKDGLKVMGKNDAGEYYDLTSVPMVNPSVQTASTTYYITNTENGKCESTTPTPVTVEVYKPVSASISAPKEVCYGSYSAVEISLDGVAQYNVVYNNGTADVPLNRVTASSVSINDALYTTTTYSLVSVTDKNGCEATITTDDQATITVNELPTIASVEIEDDDDYICQDTKTNLIVTFTGNAPFTFTINGTQYKSDDNEFEMEISQAGRYVVENLVDAKCSSAADSQASAVLYVEDIPVVTVSPTSAELDCNTEEITLTASGAHSYSWTDNKNSAPTSGDKLVAKRTDTGTTIYTVVGTSQHGCASDEVSVTVKENFVAPTVELKPQLQPNGEPWPTELTCRMKRIPVVADTVNSLVDIVKYEWSNGLSTTEYTELSTNGKHTVTVTGKNGCTATSSIEITENVVNPILSVEHIGSRSKKETTVLNCFDQYNYVTPSVSNVSEIGGSIEYFWYKNGREYFYGDYLEISEAGTYMILANGANDCEATYTLVLTEDKERPEAEIVASAETVTCSTPEVELTVKTDVDCNYFWTGVGGEEAKKQTIKVSKGDTYQVFVESNANGCITTLDYTLDEKTDLPVVEITASAEKVTCNPNTLTASGAKTYVWSTGDTTESTQVTEGGLYTVEGTNEYGCKSTAEIELEADQLIPAISLTSDTTTVTCRKETVLITAEVTNNDGARTYKYEWAQGNSTSNELSVQAAGEYKVTITDETNACFAEESIKINENKELPTISTKSLAAVCLPATVDIAEAVTSTNADNLKYYANEALTEEVTNTTVEAAKDAVYYVVGYEVEGNGCKSEPVEIKVNVKPVSSAPVVKNYDECAIEGYKTLSSLVTSDSTKLVFFADETSTEPIENKFDASAENTTTSYWVSNTAANSCESERTEIVVNITGFVDFSVEASDTRLPAGQELTLTITPLSDTPVEQYVWYRGDEVVQATDELELTEQLYLNEKYSVQAIGRCNSPKKEVDVEAIWPTAFTPHNDNGKNDDFAKGMPIIVFNRFYTKIFEGSDGWDGTINGTMNDSKNIAVPGVYYYKVDLPNGEVKKGTIEIVR